MRQKNITVVGIDVGGTKKGFHAVALRGGRFVETKCEGSPVALASWCRGINAVVVAVDAPCAWSRGGLSRLAERALQVDGKVIQCFKTPTQVRAAASTSGFYDWVFNGERLYSELSGSYALFDGQFKSGRVVVETFPHAVVCALVGKVVAAKPKVAIRRNLLRSQGYDDGVLPNVDFVDAGLCALTAMAILEKRYESIGDMREGFIVLPRKS